MVDLIAARDAEWQARVDKLKDALDLAKEAMVERRGYADMWEYKYGETWDEEDAIVAAALRKAVEI